MGTAMMSQGDGFDSGGVGAVRVAIDPTNDRGEPAEARLPSSLLGRVAS